MNQLSCIWMSHGTYEWVMLHINNSCRVELVRQPRWHDSFTCVWLTHARGRLLYLLLYSDSCYWILLQLLARVKQFDAGKLSMTHSYVCVSHSYVTRSRSWPLYLLLNWDLCLICIGFTTESRRYYIYYWIYYLIETRHACSWLNTVFTTVLRFLPLNWLQQPTRAT